MVAPGSALTSPRTQSTTMRATSCGSSVRSRGMSRSEKRRRRAGASTAPGATEYVGELYLGDIGVPPELYAGSGLAYEVGPLFARQEIVHL